MRLYEDILIYLYTEYELNITNKGVQYLAECIAEVYRDRTWSIHMTKLYETVASRHETTWKNVERLARQEVKKVSNNKLGEFILRQAIIIKQNKKRKRGNVERVLQKNITRKDCLRWRQRVYRT